MITRKSLADTIDAYDEQIAELNKSKRDTFEDYRNQMVAARVPKPEIKAEIEAMKAAIKRRRESVKDEHALIEKDALIDEVFAEITRAPRATREIIEKFATDGTKYDATSGEILEDINPHLVVQVINGMQTEAGRAALIAAVDILIEQEEAEEASNGGPSAVRPSLAARDVEESAVSNPVANVGEGATSTTAAASNDPASRTDDESERQHSSTVGLADDCRTGGKEQSDSSSAPVGDAGAYAQGIPVSNESRPADPAGSGGDPGTPSTDASGVKMELGSNPVPGRRDVMSPHSNAESERATNTNSEIVSASQGEAEAPSIERVNPEMRGSADANAGGGHVTPKNAATLNNRLDGEAVQSVKKFLRPHCRNRSLCASGTPDHCYGCKKALAEGEAA